MQGSDNPSAGAPGSDPSWKYDRGTHTYYYDSSVRGYGADPSRYRVFCNCCGTYHRNVTAEGCWMIMNQDGL